MKKYIFIVAIMVSVPAFSQIENSTGNTTKVGLIAEIMTGNELRLKTGNNFKFKDKEAVYISAPDSEPKGKTVNITAKGYYYYDATKEIWLKLDNLPYRTYDSSTQENKIKLR